MSLFAHTFAPPAETSGGLQRGSAYPRSLTVKSSLRKFVHAVTDDWLRTTRRSRGGAARGGGTPSSTSTAPGSSGRSRTFLHTGTVCVRDATNLFTQRRAQHRRRSLPAARGPSRSQALAKHAAARIRTFDIPC